MRFRVGGTLAFRRELEEKRFLLSSSVVSRGVRAWVFEVDDGNSAKSFQETVKHRPPITKAQLDELKRLARERQSTNGAQRARVQNNLVLMGFARYIDINGEPLVGICDPRTGLKHVIDACEITEEGRETVEAKDG